MTCSTCDKRIILNGPERTESFSENKKYLNGSACSLLPSNQLFEDNERDIL